MIQHNKSRASGSFFSPCLNEILNRNEKKKVYKESEKKCMRCFFILLNLTRFTFVYLMNFFELKQTDIYICIFFLSYLTVLYLVAILKLYLFCVLLFIYIF